MVEVIVAISVLAIGVLGVAAFFANSARLTRLASNESIATNLAQGYVDNQMSEDYNAIVIGQTPNVRVSTDQTSPFYNFYTQTTVTYVDSNLVQTGTDLGLKKIHVAITYQEYGTNKNVTLESIATKK